MEDDILTIEEVAKYLRVSERTVYDWAQKGEIPSGKIGTVWRFKKSEIETWVNSSFVNFFIILDRIVPVCVNTIYIFFIFSLFQY